MPGPTTGRHALPTDLADERQHRRLIATALNGAMQGHINCGKTVTLVANAASTTVVDARINLLTAVLACPLTADAAAEIGAGTMYFTPAVGQVVITHANNAQADRTFNLAMIG